MADLLCYPLCTQTVTLYHPDAAAGTVTRRVVTGAFLDRRTRLTHGETGQQQSQDFVLILPAAAGLPGQDYILEPGDRVLEGEGPNVSWENWPAFVPAVNPGVCCVQYVDPKEVQGRFCHLEAGGWWNRSGSGARSLTS